MNETQQCAYEGCNEDINVGFDDKYCVFHAPPEKKGISVKQFNALVFKKVNKIKQSNINKADEAKEAFIFDGFAFPGNIIWAKFQEIYNKKLEFNADISFCNSKFAGQVSFNNIRFLGDANFRYVRFAQIANFSSAQFEGDADFRYSQFSGVALFINAEFSKYSFFDNTEFSGEADFDYAQFGDEVYFLGTLIWGALIFKQTRFDNSAYFSDLIIKETINIENITLADKARFYFRNPQFEPKKDEHVRIIFDTVQFNPFAVYIENVKTGADEKYTCLIFRYCQLKDVYFTNNDMSLFSFYKSSFDQARFVSCQWDKIKDTIPIIPFVKNKEYDRLNIIREEKLFDEIKSLSNDNEKKTKLMKHYHIGHLTCRKDIAALYRQMKTALDNTKDYQEASWFYFNEFEMKRKAMEEEIESKGSKLTQFFRKLFSKYFIYFWYKVLAGYGEKPLWSFGWFTFFLLFIFTPLNLIIGVKPVVKGHELGSSIWDSFIFSLYRILPTNYVPFARDFAVPPNFWGLIIPFINTLVLILMIAFIGIGLKRHFRRF